MARPNLSRGRCASIIDVYGYMSAAQKFVVANLTETATARDRLEFLSAGMSAVENDFEAAGVTDGEDFTPVVAARLLGRMARKLADECDRWLKYQQETPQ